MQYCVQINGLFSTKRPKAIENEHTIKKKTKAQ